MSQTRNTDAHGKVRENKHINHSVMYSIGSILCFFCKIIIFGKHHLDVLKTLKCIIFNTWFLISERFSTHQVFVRGRMHFLQQPKQYVTVRLYSFLLKTIAPTLILLKLCLPHFYLCSLQRGIKVTSRDYSIA